MTKEKEVKELHYGGDSGFPPRRRRRRPSRDPRRRQPIPLRPDGQGVLNPRMVPADETRDPRRRPQVQIPPGATEQQKKDLIEKYNPRRKPRQRIDQATRRRMILEARKRYRDRNRRRPPTTGDQSRKAMEEFNKRMRQQLLKSRGNNQSISATPATQKPRLPRNVRSLDQTLNPRRIPTATPRPSGRMVANGGVITKNNIGANDFREGGYVLSTVDNRKNKK